MSFLGIHKGAWNLPEFGLSERYGDLFGVPRSRQGGSQLRDTSGLLGTPYRNDFYVPIQQQQVLGRQTGINQPQFQTQPSTPIPAAPSPAPDPFGGAPGYIQDLQNQLYGQLDSQANEMMAGLDPQRAAQEGIIQNTYNQGISDLQANQSQGLADLASQERVTGERQVKSLNDLSANLRNMFQAGQTFLGARGAGDSSAAGQYSYALTQMGNKNRGNIMAQTAEIKNQINDRTASLQRQVMQGTKQLSTEKQNALLGISQWFAGAQNQIRQAKGQNIAALGQQALDNAMNAIRDVNAQHNARYNSLLQWAENNATTIQGLKANLQQIAQFNPAMPQAGTLPGISGGAVGSNGQFYSQSPIQSDKKDWWNQ